ncbi:MAG: rhomboid family intramembrane serine protease [Treponema sp.]|nr:rhomboid family intramembrane serine protease [Treponema sp.]
MKIKYNAPVILTYTFFCAAVTALSLYLAPDLTKDWFMVPGREAFSFSSPRSWLTLLTHAIGHSTWSHLVGNFSIILLIGPMLEENYGSFSLFVMIIITAAVTGILNVLFFTTALMGASGVVFMMILLASFTNFTRGEIPLTFILVMVLYLGDQLMNSLNTQNISHFAHIAGGFCGSLFGFIISPKRGRSPGPLPPPVH